MQPSKVLEALAPPGITLADAQKTVPERPGLYAIYGDAFVWHELGLGDAPDTRPLYVGKAEESLASRDVRTHFGIGRTGSSTVRRSFAALLREKLSLTAQPRNPAKPERPSNYGLPADQDHRLTQWMRANLLIAVWVLDGSASLRELERAVLGHWAPPLNLTDVSTPWTAYVKSARKVMADQARTAMANP